MQITEHIHALKIPFNIPLAPNKTIERQVYCFLVTGKEITLIDSGVAGAQTIIFDYLEKLGRRPGEIARLILSHSHPDHIGAAQTIKNASDCQILAHGNEREWIENTEKQAAERPVPGFQSLVAGPVTVDRVLADGDRLELGVGLCCKVLHTPGHSPGSISLFFNNEEALFTGDTLPLPGDLPIYDDISTCLRSIAGLRQLQGVTTLLSSWEAPVRGTQEITARFTAGVAWLEHIHQTVLNARKNAGPDMMALCQTVVAALGLPPFAANPLVAKAFASSLTLPPE